MSELSDLHWEPGRLRKTQKATFEEADITDDFKAYMDYYPNLEVTVRRYKTTCSVAFAWGEDTWDKTFTVAIRASRGAFEKDFSKYMADLRSRFDTDIRANPIRRW